MKNLKLSAIAMLLLLLAGCYVYQPVPVATAPPPPPDAQPQQPPAPGGDQVFYDQLAPYGTWVDYPRYGYVWLPNVGPDFRPYCTEGYWAYSDQGWMWVSDYPWGWAPFHYGTWISEPGYGWMWVPGNQWAPSWVAWGNYNGYYGWAPLQPNYMVGGGYNPPIQNWYFTDARYMGDPAWQNHYYYANKNRIVMGNNTYVESVNNIVMVNNSNTYNGSHFNAGPRREEVESAGGRPVQVVHVSENDRPMKSEVNNGSVNIYRPQFSNASNANKTARPANVVPIENVKRNEGIAPVKQQQRTPEMNNETKPAPVQQPTITPQQQRAPQQQQNYQNPQRTNGQPSNNPVPQKQQQGKGQTKQKNKPKQPVKNTQEKKAPSNEAPSELKK